MWSKFEFTAMCVSNETASSKSMPQKYSERIMKKALVGKIKLQNLAVKHFSILFRRL